MSEKYIKKIEKYFDKEYTQKTTSTNVLITHKLKKI